MPLGSASAPLQHGVDRRAHAEHVEVDPGILLVEDAQHDAFAGAARQRRDAHVEQLAAQRQPDAAVLRHAPLGDVEARHHLDAADDDGRDMRRHAQRLAQHAVDPHADDEAGLIGLDMDVGHALPRGIGDDAVDQADRGRVVGGVEQIVGGRKIAGEHVELVAQPQRPRRNRRRLPVHRVAIRQEPVEILRADEADVERPCEIAAHFEQHLGIRALAHRDREMAALARCPARRRSGGQSHRGSPASAAAAPSAPPSAIGASSDGLIGVCGVAGTDLHHLSLAGRITRGRALHHRHGDPRILDSARHR